MDVSIVCDHRLCSDLLTELQTPLLTDRGCDARLDQGVREWERCVGKHPCRNDRKGPISFGPYFYRARNLVERFINKIDQCRRIATGYDKLAANFLAFIKLASIRL